MHKMKGEANVSISLKKPTQKPFPWRALFLCLQEYGILVVIAIYKSTRNEVLNK